MWAPPSAKALLPALPRGWLLEKAFDSSVELPRLQTLECWSFHYDQARLNADIIAQVRHQGRQVLAWTVNDPAWMLTALSRGVDGLITDKPDLARRVTARRAAMSDGQRLLVALLVRVGARVESLESIDALRP